MKKLDVKIKVQAAMATPAVVDLIAAALTAQGAKVHGASVTRLRDLTGLSVKMEPDYSQRKELSVRYRFRLTGGMKVYLVSGNQRDGEHEHYVYTLVRAKNEKSLNLKLRQIFKKQDAGEFALDHEKAFFGYGDCLTLTLEKGYQEITPEQAAVLVDLNVVDFWN